MAAEPEPEPEPEPEQEPAQRARASTELPSDSGGGEDGGRSRPRTLTMADPASLAEISHRIQLMTEGHNFRGVAIFGQLKQPQLRRLALQMEVVEFSDSEAIVEMGDEGDGMYIIEKGICSVRSPPSFSRCLRRSRGSSPRAERICGGSSAPFLRACRLTLGSGRTGAT